MKTDSPTRSWSFWLRLFFLGGVIAPLRAEQFGLFTYQVLGGAMVEITDYPVSAVGPVNIPAVIDGKPVTSIGEYAFSECSELTSVAIPASVTSIGASAFYFCSGLAGVQLQSGLTTIGESAFQYCSGLTSITLPSSVTSIGGGAFEGCSALASMVVEPGNPQYSSAGGVLLNAAGTILIFCPEAKTGAYTIPSSVTAVGGASFAGCSRLISVTIPASVTSIGDYAFTGCSGLTSLTIPSGVNIIAGGTFQDCSGLISVTLPPGVTAFGESAFFGCSALTTFTIPASVTTIGDYAFSYCSGLMSVTIPPGVTAIGDYAFANGSGLTSITIPASVSTIGYSAFYGCSSLTTASFYGNAPSLEEDVFLNTAPGFTIYFLSGRTGFSSPTWHGYAATMIDETIYPAGMWLLVHGYGYDAGLHEDPNGDGVDLRMAYALDLDPRRNLPASLPVPVAAGSILSLSFHATSLGIIYRAETSTDLQNWTTTGVTQTAPGPDQRSTASISRNGPHHFLRLTVEE